MEQKNLREPDYSKDQDWSVKTKDLKHKVDTFFIHPTTYSIGKTKDYIADLDNEKLNEETDSRTVNRMLGVYNKSTNVFAPRYRQVGIEVMGMPEEENKKYFATPVKDLEKALKYYLENINDGRPFILASHSQGSDALSAVLLNNPDIIKNYKDKLVAVYSPGWTFTKEDLKKLGLKLAESATETGNVIIPWNTVGPGGKSPTLNPGATCVNLLSWTTDHKEYPASMHKGAKILFNDDKEEVIDHFTSAKINDAGGLEIPSPKKEIYGRLRVVLGDQCYHRYDYDFFFFNLVDNVAERCESYLSKHPA